VSSRGKANSPIAFESPDHLAPKGTAVNNSTNKNFILHMEAPPHTHRAKFFWPIGHAGRSIKQAQTKDSLRTRFRAWRWTMNGSSACHDART
jgi:hypothetical protein